MSRKHLLIMATALLALAVACGSAEEPTPTPPGARSAALTDSAGEAAGDRMIVRQVSMSLVVQDPVETSDTVTQMVQDMEGFIVSSTRRGGEEDTVVTVTFRVPTERTDEAIQRLRTLAERVTSEEVRAQDVTEEYVDIQAQLRNLEATETQLLTLMQRADTVDETLTVQRELTRVSGDIEQHTGRLQYLERTSATSIFSLALTPAAGAEPLVQPGWQPLEIAKNAIRGLVVVGQGLGNLGIYLAIWSPLWIPVVAIAWYIWRREMRQKGTSRTNRPSVLTGTHTSTAPQEVVVCPNCNHEMPAGAGFCTSCGHDLSST